MPIKYQCSVCGEYKEDYESYFCLICQDIICKDCAKVEPLKYKCFKCNRVYSKKEARENFTECKYCFTCNICSSDLEAKFSRGRYHWECPNCGWSSEFEDPIMVSNDKLKLLHLSRNTLNGKRLYEEYRVYCPKCNGTLVNTVENTVNTLTNIFPRFIIETKSFPVDSLVELPYKLKNPRPEGAFFRLDWEDNPEEYEISTHTKSVEFNFRSPFIKMPKRGTLSITAHTLGEIYLNADLTYRFEEIRYGSGKTRIKVGPLVVYPKIEIKREIEKPYKIGETNRVIIKVANLSGQEIKQFMLSDVILEGAKTSKRHYWGVKNLEDGGERVFEYSFEDSGKGKLKFDSLRAKIRFSKFQPHLFFNYVSPVKLVEF